MPESMPWAGVLGCGACCWCGYVLPGEGCPNCGEHHRVTIEIGINYNLVKKMPRAKRGGVRAFPGDKNHSLWSLWPRRGENA